MTGSASPPPSPVFVLSDGSAVELEAPRLRDEAEIARLVDQARDGRSAFYERAARTRAEEDGASSAALVARTDDGQLIGYAAFLPTEERGGELAGAVDPRYIGRGLGTLLARRLAERAHRAGLETLAVELHPGSETTGAMLRDLGFATHWDIDYPATRVTLSLGVERPGWATPPARASGGA